MWFLSVKISKCDFDSLAVIYLSAASFVLWYPLHEDRIRSTTTTLRVRVVEQSMVCQRLRYASPTTL